MTFTLNVDDVDAYGRQLAVVANVADDMFDGLRDEFAHEVVIKAQKNASGRPGPRVRTGRLRSSIQVGVDGNPEADAPYAGYVEFGTSRMRPRPFMRPAVNSLRPKYRKLMIQLAVDLGIPKTTGRKVTTRRRGAGGNIPKFSLAEQIAGGQYTP